MNLSDPTAEVVAPATPTKNIFLTKTFWLNIAGLAISLAGIFPPEYAVPIMAVANIIVRLFTNQPVNIAGKSDEEKAGV